MAEKTTDRTTPTRPAVKALKVGTGVNDVLIKNDKAGISFTLPLNPTSIKWTGEPVFQRHDTRSGYHYQFIKYRRTGGVIAINTGSGRGITFRNAGKTYKVNDAYNYMMVLGGLIERWMKLAAARNVGPLTLIDNGNPSQPITMDIFITSLPQRGPEAATTSHQFQIPFEIANDYSDKLDVSSIKADVLPALARARDIVYKAKKGETIDEIAAKIYNGAVGMKSMLMTEANKSIMGSDGKITKDGDIIAPYAPLPREYVNWADTAPTKGTKDEKEKADKQRGQLDSVGDVLSGIVDLFASDDSDFQGRRDDQT